MDFCLTDTIAALASAAGSASRGIVRISGPEVISIIKRRFTASDSRAWVAARSARSHSGLWRLDEPFRTIPVEFWLWPSARSYTGESAAELHTVGSPPLLEAVLDSLYREGVRPARAGEFTLRSFLAGRIDLPQAEAVLGVVDAASPRALDAALQQLAGGLSGKIHGIRADLLDLLAEIEAGLDFAEEGIEFVSRMELSRRIAAAQSGLKELLAQGNRRMRSSARLRVVLAGAPNAGKSTLFNALAGNALALVSAIPGTTRDSLRAELEWDGLGVELIDTAGWDHEPDPLLREALALRLDEMRRADLILWCRPVTENHETELHPLSEEERRILAVVPALAVVTKADLASDGLRNSGLWVSGITKAGLDALVAAIVAELAGASDGDGRLLGMTAIRCRESLNGALAALERAHRVAESSAGEECLASDIREALEELGKITGALYTDDILDRIFSKFCIGK